MKKRFFAILLTLATLVGLLTFSVSAEEIPANGTCGENLSWVFDAATGTLTISGQGAMYDYKLEGEGSNPAPWNDFASEIKQLVIGEDVTSIGREAFCETSLGKVDLSATNITAIGASAFAMSDLTEIKLPHSMTEIGTAAFMEASKLESVEIPDSVTAIHSNAFTLCSSLDSLTIPSSVTYIGNIAFCYGVNEFYFEGDAPQMAAQTVTGGADGIGGKVQLGTFANCTPCTIYYPKNNPTWNDEVFNTNWGSEINWIAYEPDAPAPQFTDVVSGSYYEDAVAWAVEAGVTTGTSATTFSPEKDCIRAQVVTFLWRAAGEPAPKTTSNPFSDVKEGEYYYDAVLWAVENGITDGIGDGKFGTGDVCTRAQVATFLWRAANKPAAASSTNPFEDVASTDYFYNAVLWAAGEGITTGTTSTTFAPSDTCNRAQIVTFLYRYMTE